MWSKIQGSENVIYALQSKLNKLLAESAVAPDQVDILVEEQRNAATAQSSRDVRSNGRNLEKAIGTVSNSARVRATAANNDASTSKERTKFCLFIRV